MVDTLWILSSSGVTHDHTTICLASTGVHHQHEVESHWSDPADLCQRGDCEALGQSGLSLRPGLWLRLALSAEPQTPLAGQRRGLVQPGRTQPQAPQHVCRVGALWTQPVSPSATVRLCVSPSSRVLLAFSDAARTAWCRCGPSLRTSPTSQSPPRLTQRDGGRMKPNPNSWY